MKAGKLIGIVLAILGLITFILIITVFNNTLSIPKIIICGPSFLIVGVAMIIFPGGNITVSEINNKTKLGGEIWSGAPTLHKIVWILSLLLGTAAVFYQLNKIGLL
ncbi:MAG: hypothetical protein JKY30_13410 [Flavobacteriales bacterium]|nr:hypothetical protein [Flavobacteriales bacterium]